jgi:hypothetical protein
LTSKVKTAPELSDESSKSAEGAFNKDSDVDPIKKAKKMSAYAEEECANCAAVGGRAGIVLSKCSKCLMVSYCSRACQLQHWKEADASIMALINSFRPKK